MKLIVYFGVVLMITTYSFSQGILYQKGKSGLGFGAGLAVSKDASGYSGTLSYTINGMLTIGGQIGNSKPDKGDISATGYGPYLIFYPLKYSDTNPITLALGLGLIFTNYSSEILNRNDLDMTGNTIGFNAAIYSHLKINETSQIIPGFAYEYDYTKAKLSDNYGHSEEDDGSFGFIRLSADIAFDISPKVDFMFGPSISFGISGENNSGTSFGISGGLAIKKYD